MHTDADQVSDSDSEANRHKDFLAYIASRDDLPPHPGTPSTLYTVSTEHGWVHTWVPVTTPLPDNPELDTSIEGASVHCSQPEVQGFNWEHGFRHKSPKWLASIWQLYLAGQLQMNLLNADEITAFNRLRNEKVLKRNRKNLLKYKSAHQKNCIQSSFQKENARGSRAKIRKRSSLIRRLNLKKMARAQEVQESKTKIQLLEEKFQEMGVLKKIPETKSKEHQEDSEDSLEDSDEEMGNYSESDDSEDEYDRRGPAIKY